MAIITRDNRFNDLLKVIRTSKLIPAYKKELYDYVHGVKNGYRNNDFFDDEFLERIILELITEYTNKAKIYDFDNIIEVVKLVFPYGENTENYEKIRNLFINNLSKYKNLFGVKLHALFDDKRDYVDIINIIYNDEDHYSDYSDKIFDYAVSVSPYCQNQEILKREIIAFINNIDKCDDIDALIASSLEEAKKRVGIYPVDEKTLSLITSEARKAQNLIHKLENLQARINNYQKEVDETTKSGIEELQGFIDKEKGELIRRLDEHLLQIEKQMRSSSDKVLKDVLLDTQRRAALLSSRTTDELLRVQKTIQEYVENDPQVKQLIQDAGGEAKIKEILSSIPELQGSEKAGNPLVDSVPGIYIPGNDRLVVPMNSHVVLPDDIDTTTLIAFDESIPFDERMQFILDQMEDRKAHGEIFHEMTEEVIRCVMEGDWVYLWGPSGCGKSYVIKQVASLLGIDLVDNGKITDKYSIMAYNDPHGRFRATQAFVALVYGKMLSLDEFDNGNTDTQVVLNELYSGLLDVLEKPEKKRFVTFAEDMSVPIHPNFRMISAGNTSGDGENNLFSSRGKIDEAVQERMTPKKFFYDNRVEKIIFGSFEAWYDLFVKFRQICDEYAKKTGLESAPGIVTTRDASAISKYIRHNSKTLDQVLREKFIQVKDDNYLNFIIEKIRAAYNIGDEIEEVSEKSLSEYEPQELGKQLIYSSNNAIKAGRR